MIIFILFSQKSFKISTNGIFVQVLHEADPMAALIQNKRREDAIDRGELGESIFRVFWVLICKSILQLTKTIQCKNY